MKPGLKIFGDEVKSTTVDSSPILLGPPSKINFKELLNSSATFFAETGLTRVDLLALGIANGNFKDLSIFLTILFFGNLTATDDDTGGGDTGGGTTTTPTSDTHVTWAMKNETSGDFIFINLPKSYLDDALLNKFINLNGAGLDGVSGCWKFSDVLTFESDPADGTVSSDFNASSHDTLSDCSNTI